MPLPFEQIPGRPGTEMKTGLTKFEEVVYELGEERWPLLARALEERRPALSTKIEWLVDEYGPELTISRRAKHNFTQIFRDADLEALLDRLEFELRRGRRSFNVETPQPFPTFGGVYEILGRWPTERDTVRLYVLRDLFERQITVNEYGVPLDTPRSEWICEVSLMAASGEG